MGSFNRMTVILTVIQDTDMLDSILPGTVGMTVACIVMTMSSVFIICYATPIFIFILPLVSIIYILALVGRLILRLRVFSTTTLTGCCDQWQDGGLNVLQQ